MKKILTMALAAMMSLTTMAETLSPELQKARQEFNDAAFGIFLHWGLYSMYGQGEWYLTYYNNKADEYGKAAKAFYPIDFDAQKWAKAFKDAGAKYVCFTSRHHDGFSMFGTKESDYNIVDATPFKRDVVKELADACHDNDLNLHLYYSLIDWTRPDYPSGRTGLETGRDTTLRDWPHYYNFMNNQLTELLTNYGKVGAIWFDGVWDHDADAHDSVPFDWQLKEQYDMIHRLQPSCLVANNHHLPPFEGEDIQVFERDVPGENTAGYSGENGISTRLPLETCQTMNRSWGYRVNDFDYKDINELIALLVKTRGMGANLLLNIGPQPNGELPEASLTRLKQIGQWLQGAGETIYAAKGSEFDPQPWGTSTAKGDKIFIHVLNVPEDGVVTVPLKSGVKKDARDFYTKKKVKMEKVPGGNSVKIFIPKDLQPTPDYIVELTRK